VFRALDLHCCISMTRHVVAAAALRPICVAASCALAIVSGPHGRAQARFDVSGRDSIAAVPGLTVYTIRDNQSAACYTLFILEPSASPFDPLTQQPLTDPSPDQIEKAKVAHTLEEAAATRDREFEALRKRVGTLWTIQYETEFARIQDEYERVVRSILPGLYPPVQVAPGLRTSGSDSLNEAVRQALAESDAANAAADRARLARQLFSEVSRTREQRLAAAGPVACSAGTSRLPR
jgi:hypothetical protein